MKRSANPVTTRIGNRIRVTNRRVRNLSSTARLLLYGATLVVLIEIGILIQDTSFGTAVVLLYGLVALVFGIKSDQSFKLALVALIYIMLLTVMGKDLLAQSFAQYAFLFLCVGMVSLLKEQRAGR